LLELFPVTDRIHLIPGMNKGRFPYSHAIYVEGERRVLFDAGAGRETMQRFRRDYPVDVVVASHAHPGHLSGLFLFEDRPIFAPAQSENCFGKLDALAERFVEDPEARQLWAALHRKVLGFKDVGFSHPYDGQTSLDLESVKLDAIHTPGHTLDHHCFYEELSGTLLSFGIDLSPAGPFYVHRESSLEDYRASLHLIRAYEPRILVSSHLGVLRSDIRGAIDRFLAIIDERDQRLVEALRDRPLTLEELASAQLLIPSTPKNLAPLYREWEIRMLKQHMDRLVENGGVAVTGEGFRAV
jgi:glyoxylase-like metal-dependent hydrolase (beta-lactamase superfamily II)